MSDILLSEKYNINAKVINVGDDICIILSGGTAPHIGSVSAGIYGPGVGASHPEKVDLSKINDIHTFSFPAHEDGALSEPLAKNVSKRIKRNVVVLGGVHIDGLSKDAIKDIVDMVPEIEQKIIDVILNDKE